MKRFATVPLSVRTSDLPKRAASAVVMLAVAGAALWFGGIWWRGLLWLVGLLCFFEFVRLIFRATKSTVWRVLVALPAMGYVAVPVMILASKRYSVEVTGNFAESEYISIALILLVIGVVICTDTGAYFSGRTIGGPKIAPRISPSKTWAGLVGGMIAAGLWCVVWQSVVEKNTRLEDLGSWITIFFAGAALAIVAQCGDFFESWLKRKAALKDSSNLIPGHGGIFDRVDGLLPVILVGYLLPFPFGSGHLW